MGATGSVIEDENNSPVVSSKLTHNNSAKDENNHTSNESCPTYIVSLVAWPTELPKIAIPSTFKLKISYESLDFIRIDDCAPIIQFPFQNIICWGSTVQNFQFKVFHLGKKSDDIEEKDNGYLINLRTLEGKRIEDSTMETVQKLMVDINQRAISRQEFNILLDSIFEGEGEEHLKDDWMSIIDQFTATGRLFLAKQGMELLIKIGPLAPFEKFDLACLLYNRIINKNSFQLLVNTFDDEHERENLIHRLQLNKLKKGVVSTCAILPES
jgi:hypothetical protein